MLMKAKGLLKMKRMSKCLFVCMVGLLLLWGACSPSETACSDTQPCPTGKVCQSGACVEQTNTDGGDETNTADAGEKTSPEKVVEKIADTAPPEKKNKAYDWSPATSGVTVDLFGVSAPTSKLAWVVGAKGMILHSSDAGVTWKKQTSGTDADLRAVSFIDDQNGWVVGTQGVMLRTTDGGVTWKKSTVPVSETLYKIVFLDKNRGYAVGDGFALLRTRTGGDSWQSTSGSTNIDLHGMYFFDDKSGLVAGSSGAIVLTRDGAQTVTSAVTGTTSVFWDVHFSDAQNGWAAGEGGLLFKSINAGEGWSNQKSPTTSTIYGIHFLGKERGWLIGKDGLLYGTRDAGKTWSNEAREAFSDLYDIDVHSKEMGIIVGKGGTIISIQALDAECQSGEKRPCYTGPAGTKDVGRCKGGEQTCIDGFWGACEGELKPTDQEVCFNGEDDDCDGKPDSEENCPDCQDGDQRDCYTGDPKLAGVGDCAKGKQTCANSTWGACAGEVLPKDESCNGRDDDCDGQVDNAPKNPPSCVLWNGICGVAKQACEKGQWVACTAAQYGADYEKSETKCDGKDNDCDGAIDETCTCTKEGESRACYSGSQASQGKGECKDGQQTCTSGKWTDCVGESKPTQEICADSKDNDCDGIVDEKTQYALSFDGRTSHVDVGTGTDFEPTGGLTIEGWFYFFRTNQAVAQTLISKAQSGGYGMYIDYSRQTRGQLSFLVRPLNGRSYTTLRVKYAGLITANKWVHIAGTFDGKELRLYVDGKKVGDTKAAADTISYTKGVPLLFGAEADVGKVARSSWRFYGHMGGIRISKKAAYTADFTPPCTMTKTADTLGLWLMDENTGTSLKDQIGKNNATGTKTTWRESVRCSGFYPGGCKTP